MPRISIVNDLQVTDVIFSSTVFVGDNRIIHPSSREIAVMRRLPHYQGDEGNFDAPIFRRPYVWPIVREEVNLQIKNVNPFIKVDEIKIISASTSAVVQIGSTQTIRTEDRLKHVRQILD